MTFLFYDNSYKPTKKPIYEQVDFLGKNIGYLKIHPKTRKRKILKLISKCNNVFVSDKIYETLKISKPIIDDGIFKFRAFKNTFSEFLKVNKNLAVGIKYDGDNDFLLSCFQNSKSLTVYSEIGIEEDFREELLLKYGHSPIVTDSVSGLETAEAVFSTDEIISPAKFLFAPNKFIPEKESLTDKRNFRSFVPYGFPLYEAALIFSREENSLSSHSFYFDSFNINRK